MKFKTALLTALMGVFAFTATARNPIDGMLERIDKGASKKLATEGKAAPEATTISRSHRKVTGCWCAATTM